jgi:hypothetical protein
MSQGIHGFESHPCRNLPPPSWYPAAMAESPTLHLTAVVTKEDDWYVARCLAIEATRNLWEAGVSALNAPA